jgi:hypothetical protein
MFHEAVVTEVHFSWQNLTRGPMQVAWYDGNAFRGSLQLACCSSKAINTIAVPENGISFQFSDWPRINLFLTDEGIFKLNEPENGWEQKYNKFCNEKKTLQFAYSRDGGIVIVGILDIGDTDPTT